MPRMFETILFQNRLGLTGAGTGTLTPARCSALGCPGLSSSEEAQCQSTKLMTMKKDLGKLGHFSWCGYRDSNPGPLPWQGSALTAELHPHTSEDYRLNGVFFQGDGAACCTKIHRGCLIMKRADVYRPFL